MILFGSSSTCSKLKQCKNLWETMVYWEITFFLIIFVNSKYELFSADIDECNIMHGVCGERGECHNVAGSFECKCSEGYESHPIMKVCMGKSSFQCQLRNSY